MIIPFHLLMVMSFSLSKPQDTVPSEAPPFWPSSNSSNSLKLLGITFEKKYILRLECINMTHKKKTNLLLHLHLPFEAVL